MLIHRKFRVAGDMMLAVKLLLLFYELPKE